MGIIAARRDAHVPSFILCQSASTAQIMSETPSRDQGKFIVRMPDGMRERIKQAAEITGRSMNAEIVQRLKWSFDLAEDDGLRILLPADIANALMTDAAVHGVQDEDRAVEIISAAYSGDEVSSSLANVRKLAAENEELSVYVNQLKDKQDTDFLLYYSKVVQLRQLAQALVAAGDGVPANLSAMAHDLDKLTKAEIETLANRHEDAMFSQKLAAHRRRLDQEITETGDLADDDDPITPSDLFRDPG